MDLDPPFDVRDGDRADLYDELPGIDKEPAGPDVELEPEPQPEAKKAPAKKTRKKVQDGAILDGACLVHYQVEV